MKGIISHSLCLGGHVLFTPSVRVMELCFPFSTHPFHNQVTLAVSLRQPIQGHNSTHSSGLIFLRITLTVRQSTPKTQLNPPPHLTATQTPSPSTRTAKLWDLLPPLNYLQLSVPPARPLVAGRCCGVGHISSPHPGHCELLPYCFVPMTCLSASYSLLSVAFKNAVPQSKTKFEGQWETASFLVAELSGRLPSDVVLDKC